MALTEEQIKNLKPGDPLVVYGTFVKKDGDGDIWMESGDIEFWLNPSCFSLPDNPKHDPCRPFREGDVVRFRKVNGNLPQCRYNGNVGIKEGDIGTIVRYNERNCYWVNFHENINWCLDAAYFELVTPVEELEPYIMLENVASNNIEVLDTRTNNVEAIFYFGKDHAYTFVQAVTRAEAERDRLNAEYRNEQQK